MNDEARKCFVVHKAYDGQALGWILSMASDYRVCAEIFMSGRVQCDIRERYFILISLHKVSKGG